MTPRDLTRWRERRDLSIRALASLLNVEPSTVSRWGDERADARA